MPVPGLPWDDLADASGPDSSWPFQPSEQAAIRGWPGWRLTDEQGSGEPARQGREKGSWQPANSRGSLTP